VPDGENDRASTPEAAGTPPQIVLCRGEARAAIRLLGAELRAWRIGDRGLLWSGDARWWGQVAPVLFPLCGAARDDVVRFGGRRHPMPVHGFAAASLFHLVARSAAEATLELAADAASWQCFPYAFRLSLAYRLEATSLTVAVEVANPGPAPLPYSLGLHPGFALPGGAGWVEFEACESAEVPVVRDRLFTAGRRPSGVDGRRLAINGGTFTEGGLCFLDAASRTLRVCSGDGGVAVRFAGFSHLVLWARPGAPFLAVEGWTGHGDPEGFAGDFAERPSTRWVAPGGVARYGAAFSAF
jgi:galactose mutarotase-like enzyme